MDRKYLLIIDSIILVGSLLTVFFVVGYTQPLAIAPLNEESLIFTLPDVNYLLVDGDLKFSSPTTVFIGDSFNLESGRHYIKIDSGKTGEIREIKVETDVVLQIRRLSNGSVGVFNVGESALNVESYKIGTSTNLSLISVDSYSENGGNGK